MAGNFPVISRSYTTSWMLAQLKVTGFVVWCGPGLKPARGPSLSLTFLGGKWPLEKAGMIPGEM